MVSYRLRSRACGKLDLKCYVLLALILVSRFCLVYRNVPGQLCIKLSCFEMASKSFTGKRISL